MESIEYNKQTLNLIIKEFRKLISTYKFRSDKKKLLQILRKAFRKREKIVCHEKKDDIEYLKDNINQLKSFKNSYFGKNKYHEYRAKYLDTDETTRYLFQDDEDDDDDDDDDDYEDYKIYKTNQQYQSFSNKTLLPLDE